MDIGEIIIGGFESALYLSVARTLFGIMFPQPLVDFAFLLWSLYGLFQETNDVLQAASFITFLVAIIMLAVDVLTFVAIP